MIRRRFFCIVLKKRELDIAGYLWLMFVILQQFGLIFIQKSEPGPCNFLWLLWEFSMNLTCTGDSVSIVKGERCTLGSIPTGLPQRREDAQWSGEPFGGSCCCNMITLNLTGNDLADSEFTSHLASLSWLSKTQPLNQQRLPAREFCSDLETLDTKGSEDTFLNFSHFHYMYELQSCSGQNPSHCSKGGISYAYLYLL